MEMTARIPVPIPDGYTDSVASRPSLIEHINRVMASKGHPGQWQIEGFAEGKMVITQTPSFRPAPSRVELGANYSPTRTGVMEDFLERRGLTLVEIKPSAGYAVAAMVTPAVKTLRKSLAQALGVYPHEIDFNTWWHPSGRFERMEVRRFPHKHLLKAEEIIRTWLTLVLNGDQKAAKGWEIAVQPLDEVVTMTYGEPRRLPDLVLFKDSALDHIDPSKWHTLPVGLNADGKKVEISLKAGPHTLVVGGTGSGKSVTTRAIIAGAFARGFEVICIDPSKKMAGQKPFLPYTKGWCVKSAEEAAEMLTEVYEIVRQRVELIDRADAENWLDLPTGTVRPMLVVIDEFDGLVTVDKKPVGNPKSSPAVAEALEEWERHTGAVGTIQTKVSKLAKEARSAGVHLVVATQRPDAEKIPGSVRENLGTIIQLVAPARRPTPEALRMVFAGDAAAQAYEEIEDLMTKGRRGFGLGYQDGGAVEGFQCSLIESEEIEEYMESLGVPVVQKAVRPEETVEEAGWNDYAEADEPSNDSSEEPAVETPSWATAPSL